MINGVISIMISAAIFLKIGKPVPKRNLNLNSKEYAEQCSDFKFYYPNGIPADAIRCCVECINLNEEYLSKEIFATKDFRCNIPERQKKILLFKASQLTNQKRLP